MSKPNKWQQLLCFKKNDFHFIDENTSANLVSIAIPNICLQTFSLNSK